MKKLISFLSISITLSTISMAQNTILVAPEDVVVSREFQLNINDLTNPLNKTFGQVVKSLNEREQILTFDHVCARFCTKVQCIGYQGLVPNNPVPKPVSNLACDYFNKFFDSIQPFNNYVLDWGKDGYYLNAGNNKPTISVIDNRTLTQDKKATYGPILRIYNLIGSNNETLQDTQFIWVVDCNYNPKINSALACFDDIHVFLDSNCCVTLTSDKILANGNGIGSYDCWSNYQVEAKLWTAPNSNPIDRDSLKSGVQLKLEDIWKEFRFTVRDPVTGNSCWGHGVVEDSLPPIIIYPDTVKVSTESFICSGRWEVPRPMIKNCSNSFSYKIRSLDGDVIGTETSGYIIVNLPIGIQYADIIVTNSSGNIARKKVVLIVTDSTPPIAVCETSTIVSINGNQSPGNNIAKVFAQSFDDGSYDNCESTIWYKVIRIEELLGTTSGSSSSNTVGCNGINGDDDLNIVGNQVYFDDYTTFCCSDVGKKVSILLRVFDMNPGVGPIAPTTMKNSSGILFGKFSDCIIEVEVLDKSVPTIVAPPDIVVSCSYPIDYKKLEDPKDNTFGRIVSAISDRQKVITRDKVCRNFCIRNDKTGYPGYKATNQMPEPAPNKACNYYNLYFDSTQKASQFELDWGFDGYAINACGTFPTIFVNDLRECGQGPIRRNITVAGPNNSQIGATQTIWVVDCDPFHIDTIHCNDSTYSDVIWPNGICGQSEIIFDGNYKDLDPNKKELGKPIIVNNAADNCALISIEYVDSIIHIKVDTSIKVLRKWIITDWCQYDSLIDPNFGRWSVIQTILANDCDGLEITPKIGTCEAAKYDSKLKTCLGHINLTAEVMDNCSNIDNLTWTYKLDLNNDGRGIYNGYEYQVGPLSKPQHQKGDTATFSNNPFADNNKVPFNANGTYPIGTHKVLWILIDEQGNKTEKELIFEVKDCQAPIARCLTGVITVPMPSSGCIVIWAKALDVGSSDNCTSPENLKFFFNGDINRSSIKICCEDFVKAKANDNLNVNVEIWVEDEEGNRDFCKTNFIVQDNIDVCPDTIVNSIDLDVDNALLISPNPSNGRILINSKAIINKINVISFTGILYSSYEVNDHHTLTISDLRSGLYFIESIIDGKKYKSKKIIVFNE